MSVCRDIQCLGICRDCESCFCYCDCVWTPRPGDIDADLEEATSEEFDLSECAIPGTPEALQCVLGTQGDLDAVQATKTQQTAS